VTKRVVKHPQGYLRDSGLGYHALRIPDVTRLLAHPQAGAFGILHNAAREPERGEFFGADRAMKGLVLDTVWDGITSESTLVAEGVAIRHALADAAKNCHWAMVFDLLRSNPDLVNATRPGGRSLYTPLHQAAHGGATGDVVAELIRLGGFRTLRTANNETALKIARRLGRDDELREILTPEYRHQVPPEAMNALQDQFHKVIMGRCGDLVAKHSLRLPVLEPLCELEEPRMWFAVPGMYGGFNYWLERTGKDPLLVIESWCRVAGGSGQRHTVTPAGAELTAEGFV